MAAPSVKGFLPLCVTSRSNYEEQGIGQWPMWKRYDSVKGIVDQYVDEKYHNFFALPKLEVDKMMAEELFYWYTPRSKVAYFRLSNVGDDYNYYKGLLNETLNHYNSVVDRLTKEGKTEDAAFLQQSLKYAGQSEDNVYCGGNHVVVTVWGMRPRDGYKASDSQLQHDLFPDPPMCTVRFDLCGKGHSKGPVLLKKKQGSDIMDWQVPMVEASKGYAFTGWNHDPHGAIVTGDMVFVAQYNEQATPTTNTTTSTTTSTTSNGTTNTSNRQSEQPFESSGETNESIRPQTHRVRFIDPAGQVIKELQVKHGNKIFPVHIPQLPMVGDKQCPSWDGTPIDDLIMNDCDYHALSPQVTVGDNATEENGQSTVTTTTETKTTETKTTETKTTGAKDDTESDVKTRKTNPFWLRSWTWGYGTGFWRWLLRILLFILLVFVVLYIVYLNNPCSAQTIDKRMSPNELYSIVQSAQPENSMDESYCFDQ